MSLELPREDPLEEIADVLKAILISQTRIYDALLTNIGIQGEAGKEAANALIKQHEQFKNIGPLPFLEGENEAS